MMVLLSSRERRCFQREDAQTLLAAQAARGKRCPKGDGMARGTARRSGTWRNRRRLGRRQAGCERQGSSRNPGFGLKRWGFRGKLSVETPPQEPSCCSNSSGVISMLRRIFRRVPIFSVRLPWTGTDVEREPRSRTWWLPRTRTITKPCCWRKRSSFFPDGRGSLATGKLGEIQLDLTNGR